MMKDDEIRVAIVNLLKMYIRQPGPGDTDTNRYVVDGLVWALTGARPKHVNFGDTTTLYHLLRDTCQIPCELRDNTHHKWIEMDETWMKQHGVSLD